MKDSWGWSISIEKNIVGVSGKYTLSITFNEGLWVDFFVYGDNLNTIISQWNLASDRIVSGGGKVEVMTYLLDKDIQPIMDKIDELEKIDVIICGKQTNDSDTGHIGPQISAWLNWPNAAFVKKVLAVSENSLTVERLTEAGTDVIELPFPCVISVVKEISNPRVRSIKGRMAAKRAEVVKWTAEDIAADKNKLGIKNCPTRVVKSFSPTRSTNAVVVEGANGREKAAKLVEMLKENKYI